MKNIILIITIIFTSISYQSVAQDFLGEIKLFSGAIPAGWVACDGQEMKISDNQTLMALLGGVYGTDARNTFLLPNLNEKLAVGTGDEYQIGQSDGSNTITLKKENLPDLHGKTWDFNPKEKLIPSAGFRGRQNVNIGVGSEPNNTIKVSNSGTSQPIDIRQPSLSLRYAICVNGVYPPLGSKIPGTIGEIKMIASYNAPTDGSGWAVCDGSLVQISDYQMAYSILHNVYGGDGRSTFGLPDLSDRVPVGAGQGDNLPNITLGAKDGTRSYFLHNENLPLESVPNAHMAIEEGGEVEIQKFGPGNKSLLTVGNKATGEFDFKTKHTPISLVQSSLGIYYIICLEGDYPSR